MAFDHLARRFYNGGMAGLKSFRYAKALFDCRYLFAAHDMEPLACLLHVFCPSRAATAVWVFVHGDDFPGRVRSNRSQREQAVGLDDHQEQLLTQRFNQDRDEEYEEFLDKCNDFEKRIDKENFTYTELQEN